MRNHQRFGFWAFIMGIALWGAAATAQMPQLLPVKSVPAPKAVSATTLEPAGELADAQTRLNESREALARIRTQLNRVGLPNDVLNETLKQFNLRQTLTDRYAQQVEYLKQLQVLEQNIGDARQQLSAWAPPAGEPPWPLSTGDTLRSDMLAHQAQITQLGSESAALSNQIVDLARQQSDAEVQLRQLQEKLGALDAGSVAKLSENARAELERKRLELALKSAVLLRSDLNRRVKDTQRALQELRLASLEKTWAYYDGRFELSPETLATVKTELQNSMNQNRDLEIRALYRAEAAAARLTQVKNQYDALNPEKTTADRLRRARAALDIAQADEVTARSEVERLRQLVELANYTQQAWDARAQIYATPRPDAAKMAEITRRVQIGRVRTDQARGFLQQTLSSSEQEASDLRKAMLTSKDSLDRQVLAARLQAANAQTDTARSVLSALENFDQLLKLLQLELGISEEKQSWSERVLGYWQRAEDLSGKVWRYELFTVDDQIIADGKEVKTTRSVTVGKSIGAIGILLFGFLMVSWLIRAAIGIAERRIGLKASVATLIRRWLMLIATATLIVLSFNLVQIPLSVFAFLGGALAIGVGFGTQNLLKNLISGVMLLVERPLRIGDLVEIDNVRGRVTSIGIRFSTIHGSDGIDTLIPNSELVEKKLTNWTYGNPAARREIRVGVAYGSDPLQVQTLLQGVASGHPGVMSSPAPMVVLDDLAESALLFTLRFWVRLDQGLDGRVIDSDLRCRVLQKLAEAGIDIPFPQRDVHVVGVSELVHKTDRGG